MEEKTGRGIVMSEPTPRRNFFCLWAGGEKFDVESYTKCVAMKVNRFWQVGEIVNGIEQHSNGLEIELGDGTELSMQEQQQVAVEFLSENRQSLVKLRSSPGLRSIGLGLQEMVHADSAGSIMDLDPALMRIVLDIGIEVTIWACVSHERSIPV